MIVLAQAVGTALIMPLAGWLADDVRFGRHKVISWSIWVMQIFCFNDSKRRSSGCTGTLPQRTFKSVAGFINLHGSSIWWTTSSLHSNSMIQCLFQADAGSLSNALNGRWFIVPQILASLSELLIVISMIEYVCAQVPYSMKGLLLGVIYAMLGQFVAFGEILTLPFSLVSSWGQRTISCGFWYLLTKTVIMFVITLTTVVKGRQKWRSREDVLPNEHIFAERYYTKIINSQNEHNY